jgi:hypothetical protein
VYGKVLKTPPTDCRQSVGAESVGERARLDLPVGHFADRDEVSGGLGHRHKAHDQHRHDRRRVEGGRAEVERRADPEPVGLADPAEIREAERHRDRHADGDADQDRDPAQEGGREPLHTEDDGQYEGREREVLRLAEVLRADAAGGPVPRHGKQRDADDQDHRAGHQGREESQELSEDGREQDDREPADDHGAVDRRQTAACRTDEHHR